jgi:long-chain acyl-CoA synthetase
MVDTVPKLFKDFAEKHSEAAVLLAKDSAGAFHPVLWKELYQEVRRFAAGLIRLGVKREDHIGIISENRRQWITADLAILSVGGADVPRGADSTPDEIRYILNHAECSLCIAEDATQMNKILTIASSLPALKTLVVFDDAFERKEESRQGVKLLKYREVLELGDETLKEQPGCLEEQIEQGEADDLATLIYTSGTTGEPKGVMLSHRNFMHQIPAPLAQIDIREGDVFFSVLPVWHAYERTIEYVAMFAGCIIAYSRPIRQIMLDDLKKVRPMIFPSIPRIWEGVRQGVLRLVNEEGGIRKALFFFFLRVGTLYSKLKTMFRGLKPQFKKRNRLFDMLASFIPLLLLLPLNLLGQILVFSKIKARLGGRFRFGVSGAGALPPHVDDFFAAAGVLVLEGYGLTEAAPIVSARNSWRPVPNTIGPPLPEVQVKVLDDEGKELPPGNKGVLYVKGPNVMVGYYKRPEETEMAITHDGWLNTGDLAMLTHRGEIKILGRRKETIVLLGGENIEPSPIEDTMCESEYVAQAMVVGQDQKFLGALVVPAMEPLEEFAKEHGINYEGGDDLLKAENLIRNGKVQQLVMDEINTRVNLKRGFKIFERINRIKLIAKPFEAGVEMTHTLKLKRDVITEKYGKDIAGLFK